MTTLIPKYDQGDTGAVNRPINEKLAETISVKDFGAVGDGVTDDTTAFQNAINAATNANLYVPFGTYVISSTLTLPKTIRIYGDPGRQNSNPNPSTNVGASTTLKAAFKGPVLNYAPVTATGTDINLESLFIFGNYPVYGNENGISFNNAWGINIYQCTVAGFGTNQIHVGNGCFNTRIRDCYVAETYGPGNSNANIFIDAEFCWVEDVSSDDAKYSIYLDSGAFGTNITGCILEGASTEGIHIENSLTVDRNLISTNKINSTRGGIGITSDSPYTHIINNYFASQPTGSTIGIKLTSNSSNSIVDGNSVWGYTTGASVINSGGNTITSNWIDNATTSGLVINCDTYESIVANNYIGGGTNSVQNVANSKVRFLNNSYVNNSGVYLAPTVTAGAPIGSDFPVSFTCDLGLGGNNGSTYTYNVATYTKIGNRVFVDIHISLSALGIYTGAATLSLPFASIATTNYSSTLIVSATNMSSGLGGQLVGTVVASSNVISLQNFASGALSNITNSSFTNTSIITVSGSYLAVS